MRIACVGGGPAGLCCAISIAGAGHLPNSEKPKEFNRIIEEFIGGLN